MVSGENVQCKCEKLTIDLNLDRLLLEGNAEIGILRHKIDFAQEAEAKGDDEEKPLVPKEDLKDEGRPLEKKDINRPSTSRSFLVELKGEKFSLRWPEMRRLRTLSEPASSN